jgi:hypothetical protein
MVAAVHGRDGAALEGCQAIGNQRTAAMPAREGNAGELVVPARGKVAGQRLLFGAENADGKIGRPREPGKGGGLAVEAPEHEGRIERDRGKGVGGKADQLGLRRAGGHDHHAGGKAAERPAQANAVQCIPRIRDDLVRHAVGAPLFFRAPDLTPAQQRSGPHAGITLIR